MAQFKNLKRIATGKLKWTPSSVSMKDGAVERTVGNRVPKNEGKPPGNRPGQNARGNVRSERT